MARSGVVGKVVGIDYMAGDVPRSDVERRSLGLSIDSGCGPTRFGAATQARVVVIPVETSSPRSWNAAYAFLACFGTCALMALASGPPI